MTTPRLHLSGITKRYPAVVANSDISLTVMPGETHAVLGENGAGKSTLMKIIYGSVKPDAGAVMFNGAPVHIRNPQEARAMGISMVFQHFSLFDTITVAENVWLGLAKTLTLDEVTHSITAKAQEYGLDIDPLRPVHTLSVGEMQRVEIIRALLTNPQLLILDEPTSVLTPQAVEKLFVVLKQAGLRGLQHPVHQPQAARDPRTVQRLHRAARRQGHRRVQPGRGIQCVAVAPDDRCRTAPADPSRPGTGCCGAAGCRA